MESISDEEVVNTIETTTKKGFRILHKPVDETAARVKTDFSF